MSLRRAVLPDHAGWEGDAVSLPPDPGGRSAPGAVRVSVGRLRVVSAAAVREAGRQVRDLRVSRHVRRGPRPRGPGPGGLPRPRSPRGLVAPPGPPTHTTRPGCAPAEGGGRPPT